MAKDGGGWFLLVFLAVIWAANHNYPVSTYNADNLSCGRWSDTQKDSNGNPACLQKYLDGSFRIAINKTSGTCSVLFSRRAADSQDLQSGASMAYIDGDNWECTLPPDALTHLQKVVRMNDGDLSLHSVDTDRVVAETHYTIARSDSIVGGLTHYWRVAQALFNAEK